MKKFLWFFIVSILALVAAPAALATCVTGCGWSATNVGVGVDTNTYGGAFGQHLERGSAQTHTSGFSDTTIGGSWHGNLCQSPPCHSGIDGGVWASFGHTSGMNAHSKSGRSEQPAFAVGNTLAGGGIDAHFGNQLSSGLSVEAGTAGAAGAEGRGGQVSSHANTIGSSEVGGGLYANSLCPNCADGSRHAYGIAHHRSMAEVTATAGSSGISWSDAATSGSAVLNLGSTRSR